MKKLLLFLIASLCTIATFAQNGDPMNVNPFSDSHIVLKGTGSGSNSGNRDINSVPTHNGMVFQGNISGDPLHYCIVDDAKRLVEVTSKVRSANLSGKIVIYDTVQTHGKTYKVVNIGANAFDGCSKITSVEIRGNSLQKLASFCFKDCTSLTDIILNSNCLNLKPDAFNGCKNLKRIRASQKANNFTFNNCPARVETY